VRILHVTQYFLPWLGYQEYYLAREQARAGHEVMVLTSATLPGETTRSLLRRRTAAQWSPAKRIWTAFA